MKNKIMLFLIVCFLLLPFNANAMEGEYKTLNLDQALTQEKIDHDFSNYKETSDQITIYLFRGNGCGFCRSFLTFLNSIVPEYGKYFKVVSFEVWYDEKNSALMEEVADYLGEEAGGVPYIIIGDKVFPGYVSTWDQEIKTAIVDLYNNKDRYDVFYEMEHNPKVSTEEKVATMEKAVTMTESRTNVVFVISVITLIVSIFISVFSIILVKLTNTKFLKIQNKLDNIEKKILDINVKQNDSTEKLSKNVKKSEKKVNKGTKKISKKVEK
ncbi:MAG: thioredoxin family protein [Clostridium sp.]|nr:thioredoxin family protein [Clostridium sp.]MCM1444374.1 thioredoxin family protein [Candidatus Amulumruptor caecigallinarius]